MLFNGESGVIQEITETQIAISFETKDACDTCGLKVVCAPGKSSQRRLTLPFRGNYSVGQRVQIEEIGNLELHLALIQFGIPMIAFLLGLGFGYIIPQTIIAKELLAFIVALLELGASFFIARNMIQRLVNLIPSKYLNVRVLSRPGG